MNLGANGVLSLVRTSCTYNLSAFGTSMNLDLNGSITGPNGNGIQMRAATGGVILVNGAGSWSALSSLENKKDVQLIPDGAVARIAALDKIFFRYNEDADDRPLRVGTSYESALATMPYIAYHRLHSVMVDEASGDTMDVPEMKVVSLELCIPDILKAIDELDARLTAGGL
jgi:hypothetical protein